MGTGTRTMCESTESLSQNGGQLHGLSLGPRAGPAGFKQLEAEVEAAVDAAGAGCDVVARVAVVVGDLNVEDGQGFEVASISCIESDACDDELELPAGSVCMVCTSSHVSAPWKRTLHRAQLEASQNGHTTLQSSLLRALFVVGSTSSWATSNSRLQWPLLPQ
eukprot:CAMPEP_0171956688 /NCGR_PEP_ID=MMETSP0993-20121228/124687_1 /TAXON_ID=483369 /ORGANISM="non described non described, Strain CCMP2098" /LENGTH=162 /DNA_ID=CAMNT_0012603363 /DNA_START=49 /DNA_END=537 /DNA_ORIENTATION=-